MGRHVLLPFPLSTAWDVDVVSGDAVAILGS